MVTATEKLPPFDIEAEEAVIASLLVDPDAISRVEPVVSSEDFYRDQNRWAYDAALALWQRGETINQETLAHELARGRTEQIVLGFVRTRRGIRFGAGLNERTDTRACLSPLSPKPSFHGRLK